jgi:hypothetical protein
MTNRINLISVQYTYRSVIQLRKSNNLNSIFDGLVPFNNRHKV